VLVRCGSSHILKSFGLSITGDALRVDVVALCLCPFFLSGLFMEAAGRDDGPM